MHFYRDPFGSLLSVRKDEDGKTYDELRRLYLDGDYKKNIPFLETMADFGLCPYVEQEGMLCPDIKVDDVKGIINVLTPSNAMVLEHGQEQAENIFIRSMKENNAEFIKIDSREFYDCYIENVRSYDDFLKIDDKKKEKKTFSKPKAKVVKAVSGIIYKLKNKRDIFRYKDVAKGFYIFAGDYYIQAKEGVILDDFLDRAKIDATKGKLIQIK